MIFPWLISIIIIKSKILNLDNLIPLKTSLLVYLQFQTYNNNLLLQIIFIFLKQKIKFLCIWSIHISITITSTIQIFRWITHSWNIIWIQNLLSVTDDWHWCVTRYYSQIFRIKIHWNANIDIYWIFTFHKYHTIFFLIFKKFLTLTLFWNLQ